MKYYYNFSKNEGSYKNNYFSFNNIHIYDNFSIHCNNRNSKGDGSDIYFIVENFEAYQLNY